MQKKKSPILLFIQGAIGLLILLFSFYLLFNNEVVSLGNYMALKDAEDEVISVPNNKIDPENDGELIYTAGRIEAPIITDKEFGIKVEAIKLKRTVETYQWKEEKTVKKVKNKDGQKVDQATYKYTKIWSPAIINSDNFYLKKSYINPKEDIYKNKLFLSKLVLLGKFKIASELLAEHEEFVPINISEYISSIKRFSKILNQKSSAFEITYPKEFKVVGSVFYKGKNINNPQIGDVRISFEIVKPFDASIIGMQEDGEIKKYEYGTRELFIAQKGIVETKTILKKFEKNVYKFEIKVVILAIVLMYIGFLLIKMPFRKIILLIPYFGVYIAFSDTKRFFVIAILLTLITDGIVWSIYLPLQSLIVVVICIAILTILRKLDYKEK